MSTAIPTSPSTEKIRYYKDENKQAHKIYDDHYEALKKVCQQIYDLKKSWEDKKINDVVGIGDKLTTEFHETLPLCVTLDDRRKFAKTLVKEMEELVKHSADIEPLTLGQIKLLKGHGFNVDELQKRMQNENIDEPKKLTLKLNLLKKVASEIDTVFKALRVAMEPFAEAIRGGTYGNSVLNSAVRIVKDATGRVGYMREAIDEVRKNQPSDEKKDQ